MARRLVFACVSVLACCLLGTVACDSSENVPRTLTAPSVTTTSSPPVAPKPVTIQTWPVQITLRSVTGPDDCRTHNAYQHIGTSGVDSIQVTNADGADGEIVRFYYGVVSDDMTYEGVLHDGTFSATSVPPSDTAVLATCGVGAATERYTFSSTLTGSFSPDRHQIAATEVLTTQTPDFVQTITLDWIGNAP